MSLDDMVVDITVEEIDVVLSDPPPITIKLEETPDIIVLGHGGIGIQGPEGDQGPMGEAEEWHSSSGPPNPATGVIGDWHLNLTNGDVSEKTDASVWTLQGNIRGPQGFKGDTGAVGPPTPVPGRLGEFPEYAPNLNTTHKNGWYYYTPSTVGMPPDGNGYGFTEVVAYDGAMGTFQMSYTQDLDPPYIHIRRIHPTGVIGAWCRLYPRAATVLPVAKDVNTLLDEGMFTVGGPVNGPPEGDYWWYFENIWFQSSNVYMVQTAWPLENTAYRYERRRNNNTWLPWKKVIPDIRPNLQPGAVYTTDWNNATQNGWYYSGSELNVPETGMWLIGHVSATDPATGVNQTVYVRDADRVWRRRKDGNSVWQPWVLIWPPAAITVTDAMVPAVAPGGRLGTFAAALPGNDWNQATSNGYFMGVGAANQPVADGQWYLGEVFVHNVSWITQRAWAFTQGAGGTVYERRKLNDVWSGWVPMGGGVQVATTIGGFGAAAEGKQGLLRAGGGSHKLFTYDAAYGKWISDPWSRKFDRYGFSHNTTVSTNYSDTLKFVEDYSSYIAAGCRLQCRFLFMMANWDGSNGITWIDILSMYEGLGWWAGASAQILNTGWQTLNGAPTYWSFCDLQPNDWRTLPATWDGYQVLGARWAIQSNASPDTTTTDVREMEVISRWVSA